MRATSIMANLGRRTFLVLAAMGSPLAIPRSVALRTEAGQAPVQRMAVAAFLALSTRLTGHRHLNPATGKAHLDALLTTRRNHALLDNLSRAPGCGCRADGRCTALAREIIAAWYTGAHVVDGKPRVAQRRCPGCGPTWADRRPACAPVLPDRRGRFRRRGQTGDLQRTADVVIVGAGVAGASPPQASRRQGSRFCCSSRPRVDRARALDQFHRAAIKVPESPYPNATFAPHPRTMRSTS